MLDWEDPLPESDLEQAVESCRQADLSLILGTSLQMNPARRLFLHTLENPTGRAALCNLSETPMDGQVTACIRTYCDTFMALLLHHLAVEQSLSWCRRITITSETLQPMLANQLSFLFQSVSQSPLSPNRLLITLQPDVVVSELLRHSSITSSHDRTKSELVHPSEKAHDDSLSQLLLKPVQRYHVSKQHLIELVIDGKGEDISAGKDAYLVLEADHVYYEPSKFTQRYQAVVEQQRNTAMLDLHTLAHASPTIQQLRQWFVKDIDRKHHWQCVVCSATGIHSAGRSNHLLHCHFASAFAHDLSLTEHLSTPLLTNGKALYQFLQASTADLQELIGLGIADESARRIQQQLIALLGQPSHDHRPTKRLRHCSS